MDMTEARKLLGLDERFTADQLQSAFREAVKSAHKNGVYDNISLDLNLARDALIPYASGTDLLPFLTKEIISIRSEQQKMALRQEAKSELSDSLEATERRIVAVIVRNRDLYWVVSAIAAALAFFQNNFSDLFPGYELLPYVKAMLLLITGQFGAMAFMINRKSQRISEEIKNVNRKIMRPRTIERVLSQVFSFSDTHSEESFEREMAKVIDGYTGIGGIESSGPLDGILRIPHQLVDDLVIQDYIDFLIKSEYVNTTGISGRNLVIYRKKPNS